MRVATDRPVRFDMESLRILVGVVEEGSIAAASARTHLVASAVSKRVSELESDAGTPLLYRHSRGVQATPAGEALYHHAKRLVEHLQQISDELSEYSEGVRGHARIYVNFTAMVQYLPDALHSFLRANPEVRIDMVEKTSDQVVHAVVSGVADLGICSAARGSLAGLEVRPYRTDKLVVLVPADHRLAGRKSVRFDETQDDDVVSMPHGTSIHKLCTEVAESSGRRLRVRIEVTSFEGVRNMVAGRTRHRRAAGGQRHSLCALGAIPRGRAGRTVEPATAADPRAQFRNAADAVTPAGRPSAKARQRSGLTAVWESANKTPFSITRFFNILA